MWAIFLSATLVFVLWFLTYTTIANTTGTATERAVDVDLAGLADIYVSGGNEELIERIEDRLILTQRDGNAPHYMLATNDGTKLAGDLQKWPSLSARLSEAGEIILADGSNAHARATQLGPDLRLLVARDRADVVLLQRQIGLVFLGGGAALVLAIGLLGRTAAQRLSRRINRVNNAFAGPSNDLLDNYAKSDSRDEIDELTGHSASALERQRRLVEAHRETSDQIAHEIRTPLMHIDSKLVKALKAGADAENSKFVGAARDDIRRLVSMLESLLDIASSKARQGDRHGLHPFNLSEMVSRIGELYVGSAEESGHIFEYRVTPDVMIEGEEMQLTRLTTNLLDNAFKYVPAGGSVVLSLEPGPVLKIVDDGPGIEEGQREAIFERFRRGKNGQGDSSGAGLGLALARAIAERHGMVLELAESKVGACFILHQGDGR